jgi:histidinol-phosphate aminotransferase
VLAAIRAVLADAVPGGAPSGDTGNRLRLYPDPACTELREVIAAQYGVKPEQVFAGNGSDEVLAFVFAAFFQTPGPTPPSATLPVTSPLPCATMQNQCLVPVLFPDITYSFYPVYAGLWDVPFRTIPLAEDFSVNLRDYLVPNGGVILPNPNAPTGRVLPLEDVLALATYQEKQHRVLVVDEAYAAFGAESAIPHIGTHRNLLTVHTLSKSASLAGLRVGFAIGDAELVEGLNRVKDSFNSYTLDRLALAGAAAAVSDKPYYDEITRRIIATRDRVASVLSLRGFQVIPSGANFIFIRSPKTPGPELFVALRERGILVRHFNKPRIADYLRVSIGADEEMDTFLAACGEIEEGGAV